MIKKVEIHVTEKCQNNCVFCSVNKHPLPEPSLNEIYKDINRTKNKKFSRITITGGEPTLRKDLFKIIKYASKEYDKILIETNGTNFTYDYVKKMIELGVSEFKISFHSYNKEIFSKISKNPESFQVAKNALDILKKVNNISVGTNTVITKYNYNTLNETVAWINKKYPYLSKIRISYPRFYPYKKNYCKNEIVSLNKVKKKLEQVRKLSIKKVFFENVPLCICDLPSPPHFNWELYLSCRNKLTKGMDERYFPKKCLGCKKKEKCQGLHKYYSLYFNENFVKPFK